MGWLIGWVLSSKVAGDYFLRTQLQGNLVMQFASIKLESIKTI